MRAGSCDLGETDDFDCAVCGGGSGGILETRGFDGDDWLVAVIWLMPPRVEAE